MAGIHDALGRFDVILGTSGHRCLTMEAVPHLKAGTLLISGSTGDIEFPSAAIRASALAVGDCHEDIRQKEAILVNGGFPINFSDDSAAADPESMCLTRGLMTVALFQAMIAPLERRIHSLEEQGQRIVIHHWRRGFIA
jgi:hypothetical protein